MNFTIRALALLFILEFTKSSSTEVSSSSNLNKISFSKKATLYGNVTSDNIRNKEYNSISSTDSILKHFKRWKIDRLPNKQYGIINILWQKTKIFIEQDYSNLTCKATTIEMTPDIQNYKAPEKATSKLSTLPGKLQTSTPSYIEFYYLDQSDDRIKRKHPSDLKLQKLKKGHKTTTNRGNRIKSPAPFLFNIHTNTLRRKHTPKPNKSVHRLGQSNFYRNKLNKSKPTSFISKSPLTVTTKAKATNNKKPKQNRPQKTFSATVDTKGYENKRFMNQNNSYTTELLTGTTSVIKSFLEPVNTAAYDKVKFFEMYDNNTPKWENYFSRKSSKNVVFNNDSKTSIKRDDQRILLHHVNENIGHQQDKNKTRYVKKHIEDLYSKERLSQNQTNISEHFNRHDLKFSLTTAKFQIQIPFQKNFSCNRPVSWTEFPFIAVYIYEPSQVHCDAAGISPHWLLAAASCLSRHRKGLRGGGLSAFVTFCSNNWKYPQTMSYVKRTLIHPLYHPRDKLRRLFNAGLIQVVNSMADTCNGWSPVSLMSHQYTADDSGSIGTAVGWGLDRYDGSYSTINIPSHPLAIYEGRIYSRTCPGSSEYSQVKNSEGMEIRNVYCLLLPPYLAEENDTVHGALLLIGGKLLALYLKEERRPWGVQSAQYASIWRLLPWIAETAREPDESFQFEI